MSFVRQLLEGKVKLNPVGKQKQTPTKKQVLTEGRASYDIRRHKLMALVSAYICVKKGDAVASQFESTEFDNQDMADQNGNALNQIKETLQEILKLKLKGSDVDQMIIDIEDWIAEYDDWNDDGDPA